MLLKLDVSSLFELDAFSFKIDFSSLFKIDYSKLLKLDFSSSLMIKSSF